MEVVGYTYDADQHCVECTEKYVKEIPIHTYREDKWHNHDMTWKELVEEEVVTDSEGNPIHPIFDTDEAGDSPDHCGDCGEYINTSWHSETVNYATGAFINYIDGWIEKGEGAGNPEVLDIWASEMQWMWLSGRDERAKELYEYIRKDEGDV